MKIKAIGLMSGGLDSILAGKLVTDQGIDVTMLTFSTPFFECNKDKKERLQKICNKIGAKLKVVDVSTDYIKMLKMPRHGFGKNMNPCIDCKILFLKKAKAYAKKVGAKFVFTGEVAGQRPMSQNQGALNIISKEAGLKNKIVRPLSAKLFSITEAEEQGWIDRNKLLDIHGRGRNKQLELAKKWKIVDYQTPAGGCLLTCDGYSNKVNDLFKHKTNVRVKDVEILKIGRHFRIGKNKIVVGRNKSDNEQLVKLRSKSEHVFEVPGHGSPVTLLMGKRTARAIKLAAKLTARYSDTTSIKVLVKYGQDNTDKEILVKPATQSEIEKYRI